MILDVLLESALRSLVLSLLVGLALWVGRTRSARLQMTAWTLVLASALSMPLLMRWRAIELHPPRRVAATAPLRIRAVRGSIRHVTLPSARNAKQMDWRTLGLGVYTVIAGVLLARLLTGLWLTLGLWHRARRIREPWAARLDIRETAAIGAPVTFGSSILLPDDWRSWDELKLRVIIAHERAHVTWGDFYVQLLGRTHVVAFWFSPMAWWLQNKLIHLAEAASDDMTLQTIADRSSYAQILLGFERNAEPTSAAVAMARPATVKHRVKRILSSAVLPKSPNWKRYVQVVAAVVAVAVIVAGFSIRAQPSSAFGQSQPREGPVKSPTTATAPQSSKAPNTESGRGRWQSDKHGDAYAIVSGDSLTMSGSEKDARRARSFRDRISGDYIWFEHEGRQYLITDPATVKRAQELFRPQEALGREQAALGEKQARLGEQQALLGARQAEASVKVPALDGVVRAIRTEMEAFEKRLRDQKLGELTGTEQLLGKLEHDLRTAKDKELTQEQLAELQSRASEVQSRFSEDLVGSLSELQSRVAELQSRIGELQPHVGEKQSELGREQSVLGEEQSKLGEQQSRLGEEQSRLAEQASRLLHQIFEECLRNGTVHSAK